jgi:hypothetical protein
VTDPITMSAPSATGVPQLFKAGRPDRPPGQKERTLSIKAMPERFSHLTHDHATHPFSRF